MRRWRRLYPVVAVLTSGLATGTPSPVMAQGPVAGVWDVEWAQAIRVNGDGSVEIQRWGEAVLTLEQVGETVTGSWFQDIVGPVTWSVEGRVANGTLTLSATRHDSDDPQLDAIEVIRWRAEVRDEEMEGTVAVAFRRMARPPADRPFSATRRSGGGRGPAGH